jgi:hypothetical protein
MRVFFDASVIIAAFLSPSGGSALLFQMIKTGEITGVTSQKPAKLKRLKEQIEQFIATSGLLVREAITLTEVKPLSIPKMPTSWRGPSLPAARTWFPWTKSMFCEPTCGSGLFP